MKFEIALLCFIILLASASQLFAQKTIELKKTAEPPVINGYVNDKCWDIPSINEFYQREPYEGEPMTERTEVYICYDANYIYFGIKCFQNPKLTSAKEMQRDASTGNDDRVHIILDTYLDHRNAYFFGINALGAIEDAIISQNGNVMNKSWNGLFVGKAKITNEGWEAEVMIPFKTLGFNKAGNRWGLKMNRFIPKKQEKGSWPVGNLNSKEVQVSDAGIITGFMGITQGIGLDISPYFITGFDSKRNNKTGYKINGGSDIFYQVTPGLKASLSINTDFAETEADQRQINLTRFSLRLDEKRNFFLDGSNYFNYGFEGSGNEPTAGKLSPFFSRRIGLEENGIPIPVNYGAKITGQMGKWNIGMLNVSDRRDYANTNFSIARVTRNIGLQSSVGMITTFGNSINTSNNMLGGVDVKLASSKFRGNKNIALILFVAKTKTENISGRDASWGASFAYPNDLINFRIGHLQIGENFIAGIGYVPRTNIKETYGSLVIGPRPKKGKIRQYKVGGDFDFITNFKNKMESRVLTFSPVGIKFTSGELLNYSLINKYDFLQNDFHIYTNYVIPANEYNWWENQFSLTTEGSRDVYGQVSYGFGNFYTGKQNSFKITANWKVIVLVFIGGTFTSNKVKLREGEFTANIYQFNANFLFSPDLTLYNFFQYDSQSKVVGWQSRFRWILKPGNEILFVWNSGFTKPLDHYSMNESSMKLKLKYNIRF
ncbi:MAG: hydrolase [Chitinophagaceae bacterium]|nr:hydrolase [Chitinophagaceae bacterium]